MYIANSLPIITVINKYYVDNPQMTTRTCQYNPQVLNGFTAVYSS